MRGRLDFQQSVLTAFDEVGLLQHQYKDTFHFGDRHCTAGLSETLESYPVGPDLRKACIQEGASLLSNVEEDVRDSGNYSLPHRISVCLRSSR
jgi:hypothetical protein